MLSLTCSLYAVSHGKLKPYTRRLRIGVQQILSGFCEDGEMM